MASPTGTARIPTQGSWRPWVLTTTGTGHSWSIKTNSAPEEPGFRITQSNYPTVVGNRAVVTAGNDSGGAFAARTIPTRNSGNVFVGAVVAYKYHGPTKYMTIGLKNGAADEVEFGKVFDEQNKFSIRRNNANGASDYYINGWGEDGGTNNWY